jgi:ribosome recycling factor
LIDETMLEAEEKMEKAVHVLREDLASVRTGRATPNMFAKIVVDYYGAPTPVNQLASFHLPEPRMAIITPYDKSSLAAIEKAIRDSDLGVNPTNDGNIIRVVFPQLTEERRKAKEQLDRLVKDGDAGEDDGRRAEKELDDVTHKYVAVVDELVKHKEAELLEV